MDFDRNEMDVEIFCEGWTFEARKQHELCENCCRQIYGEDRLRVLHLRREAQENGATAATETT